MAFMALCVRAMTHIQKKFKDLKNNECFYSKGCGAEMLCCAKKTEDGKSYCREHYYKVYLKNSKREDRKILYRSQEFNKIKNYKNGEIKHGSAC